MWNFGAYLTLKSCQAQADSLQHVVVSKMRQNEYYAFRQKSQGFNSILMHWSPNQIIIYQKQQAYYKRNQGGLLTG